LHSRIGGKGDEENEGEEMARQKRNKVREERRGIEKGI